MPGQWPQQCLKQDTPEETGVALSGKGCVPVPMQILARHTTATCAVPWQDRLVPRPRSMMSHKVLPWRQCSGLQWVRQRDHDACGPSGGPE